MTVIRDGQTGKTAEIDQTNRLKSHSVQLSEIQEAVKTGGAFNINTGLVTLSSDAESGILYFKNLEDKSFSLDAIALGVTSGTTSDIGVLTVVKNPDSVSFSSEVGINTNRNFGSPSTLILSQIYKGSEGATITGGEDAALFFQNSGGRLYATLDLEIPKGTSVAIKYNPKVTSGSLQVYCALVGHLRRED